MKQLLGMIIVFIIAGITMRLLVLEYMWNLDLTSDMKSFISFCYASIASKIESLDSEYKKD